MDDVWYYGGTGYSPSTVSINQSGKVTAWTDSPGILRLHVISIDQTGTFGLGSTAAEIMAAQGNPQRIDKYQAVNDVWYYGWAGYSASTVSINQSGKVTGWTDSLGILRSQ